MKKRIITFAGGKLSKDFLKEITRTDCLIGVDRGATWLLRNNIIPDLAIGDFDSVTKQEFVEIKKQVKKVKMFPKQKDWTDLESAATYTIKQRPSEVIVYGGIGTRLDHSLGAIQLLELFSRANIPAKIVDFHNEIFLVSQKVTLKKSKTHRYVSLLPVTKKIVVTLKGFLYEVEKKKIFRSQTVGISNEVVGKIATIEVLEGKTLVVRSRD